MRRFLIRLFLFAAILAALDALYGIVMASRRPTITQGWIGAENDVLLHTTAPVLVFGTSRAKRHYDVRVLRDSLRTDVYNCGIDAMGIHFFSMRLRQILRRYTPRVIIYDVVPAYDLMRSEANVLAARQLMPYFHDPEVYRYIRRLSPRDWLAAHSAVYRYATQLRRNSLEMVGDTGYIAGYQPIDPILNIRKVPGYGADPHPDPDKLAALADLVALCRRHHIRLLFVVSPCWQSNLQPAVSVLRDFAARHHVPLIDRLDDPLFADSTLFYDNLHLNARGAELFTRTLIPRLRSCL